jgi:hypothetical protein
MGARAARRISTPSRYPVPIVATPLAWASGQTASRRQAATRLPATSASRYQPLPAATSRYQPLPASQNECMIGMGFEPMPVKTSESYSRT